MKHIRHHLALLLFVVALVTAACGTDEPSLSRDPGGESATGGQLAGDGSLEGAWVLAAGTVDGQALALNDQYRVTMTIEGSQIGGQAACNGYGGAVSITNGSFTVTEIAQNEMACEPEVMKLEAAFLEGLLRITDATRSGDTAHLTGDNVEYMFEPAAPVPTAELIGVTWVLDTIIQGATASSTVTTAQPATLHLDADGTFTGGTGCRELSGEYIVAGAAVHFTSFDAEGECPAEVQRQDGQVITVLEGGFTVHIEGNRLTVSTAGGEGLSYSAEE